MPLWYVMLCSMLLLGISAVAVWKIKKYPFVAVGWFWYIGTLIPVIGLIQVGGQAMADRYTYLSSIGVLIVFAWSVCEFAKKLRFRKAELITIAVFLVCSALLLVTRKQVRYWRDSTTLFERTLAVTQDNFVIHNNLGNELLDTGAPDGAIRHYTEAIEINPEYASALKNIGMAFVKKGDFEKAVEYFTRASLIRPGWLEAHLKLGSVYYKLGEIGLAIEQLRKVATIYAEKGRLDNALKTAEKALELAISAGQKELADKIQGELRLYKPEMSGL